MKNNLLVIEALSNEIIDAKSQYSCVFAYYKALRQAELLKLDIKEIAQLAKAYLEKQIYFAKKGKIYILRKIDKKEYK